MEGIIEGILKSFLEAKPVYDNGMTGDFERLLMQLTGSILIFILLI